MRQLTIYECHLQPRQNYMRLTRVFVEGELQSGSLVELPRETGAHLAKVLRARSGDEVVLFNGDGREFTGVIEKVQGSRVSASIGAARSKDRESPFQLTLVQCVPRGDRMDFIVQKATELGVARIVPVLSQRSVVRLDKAQGESKGVHWRAVAGKACEHGGRNRLPVIEAAQPLLNYLGESAPGAGLRLVLEPESAPLALAPLALAPLAPASANDPAGASGLEVVDAEIAIGPEGGFAPD